MTYDALADHSDLWRARLEEHAARLASRLLIGIELAPTPAMIAAYLGALAGGHAVLLGAPGDLAAGAVIARNATDQT